MRTIERTHQFKRDYRREAKGQYRKILDDVLMPVVADLAADQSLARYYSDHPLSGNWKGCRNCHIRPDLILVYQTTGHNTLRLIRLGSHSKLAM